MTRKHDDATARTILDWDWSPLEFTRDNKGHEIAGTFTPDGYSCHWPTDCPDDADLFAPSGDRIRRPDLARAVAAD